MRKTYPSYQDTYLDWLGEIPAHWSLGKLGACFAERNEKVSDTDYLPLSVTKNGIVPQMEHVAKTDAGDNRKRVCKNDFVINSRSDRKGSAGVSELDGSVSLISTVLEPRFYLPKFAHHLFRSYNFQEEFYRYGKGIVADLWSTRYAEMKNIVVPLLPMDEQAAIANFLDRETARIDKLIAEKQTFIKLLKEKRQALISHAFRSDNSVARAKLGYFVDLLPGYAFKSEFFSENNSDIRLLRGANVGVGSLKWDDVVYWSSDNDIDVEAFALVEGDIVFGMDRPWISAGARVAIVESGDLPCYLVQRVAKIRAKNGFNQKYIYYALASEEFKLHAEADLTGLSVPHISPDQIKSFQLPILSENDQSRLVEKIERETDKIQRIIKEVEESIALASEHRTALITAAVTGKIDVRNH